jgi:hypothetical protein
MLRFLARVLGLLLVAGSFVGLVIDGTRSIANGVVSFTPLSKFAFTLFPRTFPLIEPTVNQKVHPFLWDPVLLHVFLLPAAIVGFALGIVLLWLGQRPPEPIGFRAEP